jgi:hypothetical protein
LLGNDDDGQKQDGKREYSKTHNSSGKLMSIAELQYLKRTQPGMGSGSPHLPAEGFEVSKKAMHSVMIQLLC